jgi:spermidine synthase
VTGHAAGPAFAAAGGLALVAQTYLLRELVVALQGDETAVGLGLAAWLAGISGGALAARAAVARGATAAASHAPDARLEPLAERAPRAACTGLAGLALATLAAVVLARIGRGWLGVPPGELLSLGPALALALAVLLVPGALVGWTFVTLAAAAQQTSRSAAGSTVVRLYVLESLGALAGAVLVTFVAIPMLPPVRGVLAVGALALLFSSVSARRGVIAGRWTLTALAALLALGAASPSGGWLEQRTQAARFATLAPGLPLLAFCDTPYQNTAIGGDELRSLFASGALAASFPDPASAEQQAHLLMSLAPRLRRVFAAGGVETGMLRFLLLHPVERIDVAVPDRRAFELAKEYVAEQDRGALVDSRVRLLFDDPRHALARGGEPYDLVLILEREPETLLAARLSTVEFFRAAAARLDRATGVLVASLPVASVALAGETAGLGASLWGALREALPVVHASPAPQALLVAGWSPAAATLDPGALAARWRERGLVSHVFDAALFPVLLPPEGAASLARDLERLRPTVAPSRDDRPIAFLHAFARRQQVARSAAAPLVAAAAAHPAALALLALLPAALFALAMLARRARSARRAPYDPLPPPDLRAAAWHSVAATGACGMAWSLVLLVSYQVRAGMLYGRIGLLSALFMAGLAAGGWAARRAASGEVRDAGRGLVLGAALGAAFGALLAGLLAALGALPALGALGDAGQAALHGLLLFVAGIVTALPFQAAAGAIAAAGGDAARAAAGPEIADHLGAALAALSTAVLLSPVLGLAATALLTAGIQLLSLAASIAAASRLADP